MKRVILGGAAATALLAVLIAWVAIADPFGGPAHPTDASMLARFAKVRPALEEVVGMARQDPGIEHLAPDAA